MMSFRAVTRLTAGAALVAVAAVAVPGFATPSPAPTEIVVYKSPTCGCCNKWVDHMRANGFKVTTKDMDDLSELKADLGVSQSLSSCHTGVVAGYVIEGHVPADLVQKLLKEKPKVAGLTVPGMVMGSPGMEGPTKDKYDVLAFTADGKSRVYSSR
jgi:hypothetical protein